MTYKQYCEWRRFCESKYESETYYHAVRVEERLYLDLRVLLMTTEQGLICRAVAIGHDIIEDTDATLEELEKYLPKEAIDAIITLSRKDSVTYSDYIKSIVEDGSIYALIVKQADMCDHIYQEETLTPSLKARYQSVIPKLIGLEDF